MLPSHFEHWMQQKQPCKNGLLGDTNNKPCPRACTSLETLDFSLVAIILLTFGKFSSKDETPFISCRAINTPLHGKNITGWLLLGIGVKRHRSEEWD